jgi:hypothetical protein
MSQNKFRRICEWLIKTVIIYLVINCLYGIPAVILELIHAPNLDFAEEMYLLDTEPIPSGPQDDSQ